MMRARSSKWSVKLLFNFKPGRRFNILLFGCSASGKSSLINNLFSQNKERTARLAKVRVPGQMDQCTISFKEYKFTNDVWIYDTWGLCVDSNYSRNEFRDMLDGKVDTGTTASNYSPSEKQERRIIDVVVFVFGPSNLANEEIRLMKPFFEEAHRKGKRCLAVSTMSDLWFEENKDKVLLLEEPKRARSIILNTREWKEGVKSRIINGMLIDGVEDSRIEVLPVINYTVDDADTNDVVEFLAERLVLAITSRDHFITGDATHPPGNYNIDLFESEQALKLKYIPDRSGGGLDIRTVGGDLKRLIEDDIYKVEKEEEDGEQVRSMTVETCLCNPLHVVSKVYFKCLVLGTRRFRFFVATMLHAPREQIVGLFCHEGEKVSFFETSTTDPNLPKKLAKAFGGDFIGGYEFINAGEGMKSKFEIEAKTTHVHLALHGGVIRWVFEKKPFGVYCGVVEHCIQMLKKNTLMKEQVDTKLKELDTMKDAMVKANEEFEAKCEEKIETARATMEEKYESLLNGVNRELEEMRTGISTDLNTRRREIDEVLQGVSRKSEVAEQLQEYCKESDVDTKLSEYKKTTDITQDHHTKTEVATLLRGLDLKVKVSSGTFVQFSSTYYIVWNFNTRNDCNLTVTNTHQVKPPSGTYLVIFKGMFYGGCGCIAIQKNGGALSDGYNCKYSGSCYQSGTAAKTVAMDGINDYWQFYVSVGHGSVASSQYHDLEVIKLD